MQFLVGLSLSSHRGRQGSRIDFVLLNRMAMAWHSGYDVVPGVNSRDHSAVITDLSSPISPQHVYRPKKLILPPLPSPGSSRPVPLPSCSHMFDHALANRDVNQAWHWWCTAVEQVLRACLGQTSPSSSSPPSSSSSSSFKGLGRVCLKRHLGFPASTSEGATTTLYQRRLAHILSGLSELSRYHFYGQRALRTWGRVCRYASLSGVVFPKDIPLDLSHLVHQIEDLLRDAQRCAHKERVDKWKHRMQQSQKMRHQWLKKGEDVSPASLARPDGTLTMNMSEIHRLLFDSWMPIFRKHAVAVPLS